jgi:hypothetical protein
MNNNFLAGMLIGLVMGGFIGTLAIAFVAAGAEKRSIALESPDSRLGKDRRPQT